MKKFFDSLECDISKPVFIIGGGSSKLKYLPDNSVLYKKNVICTNNAFKLFPKCILTHFADEIWFTWNKNELKDYTKPLTTASIKTNYPKNIKVFKKETSKYIGLPPNNNTLTGNNAGQQAIGLAYLIGFKTIVLIGFDMDSTAKETHWHSEHKRPVVNKDIYNKTMIPSMNRMAIDLKQKNVEVFNINRESKLSCFPFSDLKQFL